MMDFRATKDTYEREDDEAERLMRPAPKVKPPRHDKRREDVRPEPDPDVEADRDVARDPDMTLNYKNVGGSAMPRRVLARFLYADEPTNRVRVRKKDTGNVTYVTEETLRERGGEYEAVQGDEDKGGGGEAEEKSEPSAPKVDDSKKGPEPSKEKVKALAQALNDLAESNPEWGKKVLEHLKKHPSVRGNPNATELLFENEDTKKIDVFADLSLRQQQELLNDTMRSVPAPPGIKFPIDAPKAKPKKVKPPKPAEPKPEAPPPKVEEPAPPKPEPPKAEPPKAEPPKAEPPKAEAPTTEPPKAEPPKAEAPAKVEKPKAEKPPVPKDKPKPESYKEKDEREKSEAAAEAADKNKKIVDRFRQRLSDPAVWDHAQGYFKQLPSAQESPEDGNVSFFDEKKNDFVPFDDLPLEKQKEVVENYDRSTAHEKSVSALVEGVAKNPKAQAALAGILDRNSDVSKRLQDLRSKGHDPSELPIGKNIPELAGVKLPEGVKTIGDLQKLVESKPDAFKSADEEGEFDVGAWATSKEGLESPEFKAWADDNPKITVNEDGSMLFPAKGKKRLPWNKLDDAAKKSFYESFQEGQSAQKNADLVRELSADPELSKTLRALSDPRSNISRRLGEKDVDDLDLGKLLPELRGKIPADMTAGDLLAAAKTAYPPLPEPDRREVDDDEETHAYTMIADVVRSHGALGTAIRRMHIHPDDARDLVAKYHQMSSVKIKPEDIDQTIKDARDFYVTDPAEVPYPSSGTNSRGQINIPWAKLTPEEQANNYAKHKNYVLAMSLAAREKVTNALMEKSGIPQELASTLAASMFSKKKGTPEEQVAKSQEAARAVYDSVVESAKASTPVDDQTVKRTLERTKDDPASQRAAVAYFQAQDYLAARDEFLSSASPNQIDERDSPKVLAANMLKAIRSLQEKGKKYPAEMRVDLDAAASFRTRIMDRLFRLDPEKAAQIEPQMKEVEFDEWDERKKIHDEQMAKRDKARKKYQRAFAKAEAEFHAEGGADDETYRKSPGTVKSIDERLLEQGIKMPPKPEPLPGKPFGYDETRKTPAQTKGLGRKLWDKLLRRKTASGRVAARFLAYSTCEDEMTMGTSSVSDRTAVYWGVEPYPAGTVPSYPRWQQAHARDLNDTDFSAIVKAAKEWMKSPVLSSTVEGVVPDMQYRAALDLAIRDHAEGAYSVGLHPTLYNRLLARLAGEPETETLLTVREASSGSLYAKAPGEERPMSASARLRKYASTIADTNPGIAFDLANLAIKLAEEEAQDQGQDQGQKQAGEVPEAFKEHMKEKKDDGQDEGQKQASYRSLKASVINAAKANPAARAAFMPVLQTIKKLG